MCPDFISDIGCANAFALSLISVILWCCIVVLYRLILHPLARYPGPLTARVTDWHNYNHAALGDRHREIHRQHQKYGPIVRFRPGSLSFSTPAAAEAIYGSRKARIVKSDWYSFIRYSAGGYRGTFTSIDPVNHGTRRRLLSHAFSDHALRVMEPRIEAHITKWLHHIARESYRNVDCTIDIGLWSSYLVFDVLSDLCFGKPFGVMDSIKDRHLVHLIPKATESWYTLGYHPLTQIIRRVLFKTSLGPLLGGQTYKSNAEFRKFCSDALKARRRAEKPTNDENPLKDFFHYLLNAQDPLTGQTYKTGELECESVLLVVAGSDTTSSALAATFFHLSNNPRCLSKLTNEIRSSFSSLQEIRCPNASCPLATLVYLRACINESLRISPPTPGHLPREVTSEGAFIDGTYYPSGTVVGISAYAIHHNEQYFPEPSQYHPERWIPGCEGTTAESVALAQSAFYPFSTGPKGCIGKNLAYMELSLALAKCLWLFDLQAVKRGSDVAGMDGEEAFTVEDAYVIRTKGPVVSVRQRMDIDVCLE